MGNHVKLNWKRIVEWAVIVLAIGSMVYLVDTLLMQKAPLIFLSNYSNIVLTIWQVQATISTLNIAVTAFITSTIDTAYYGICVKELLYLPRKLPKLYLSFWEMIIFSIIMIAISWLFVILDNIAAATLLLLVSIFLIEQIIIECINIVTKSDYYKQFAKETVEQIKNTILENPYKYDLWMHSVNSTHDKWTATEEQKTKRTQFQSVIEKIDAEISYKLKSRVSLIDDQTFIFYISTMAEFDELDEAELNNIMLNHLCDWIRQAIFDKDGRNIYHLLEASYSMNKHRETDGLSIFLAAYYGGEISVTIFNKTMEGICTTLQQAFLANAEIALSVIRYSILNADTDTFTKIIKAAYLINTTYQTIPIKGRVLLVSLAYLYYLAYCEPYLEHEKGQLYIDKIRNFTKATVIEENHNTRPVYVRDVLHDTKSTHISTNYAIDFFKKKQNNWEYMPLGLVKRMHLCDDIQEFLTFYYVCYKTRDSNAALVDLSLDTLLRMKQYVDNSGFIETSYIERYNEFCNWLSRPEQGTRQNENFSNSLSEIIRNKLSDEAKEIREDENSRQEKLSKLKDQISQNLKGSKLYRATISQERYVDVIQFSTCYFLKSFSRHVSLFGAENVIRATLERSLFIRAKEYLDQYNIDFVHSENVQSAYERFHAILSEQSSQGLCIDSSYNFDFTESTRYMHITPELTRKINNIGEQIINIGQWDCGEFCTIYVDSGKMHVGFTITEQDFMLVRMELTDDEIDEEIEKYKVESNYVFKEHSNSVEIQYTREELRRFLKIAMFKIEYIFPISTPSEKIGFYTDEKQDDL